MKNKTKISQVSHFHQQNMSNRHHRIKQRLDVAISALNEQHTQNKLLAKLVSPSWCLLVPETFEEKK